MKTISDLDLAHTLLEQGSVLAYPTEAVYGLGCDPFNEQAVERILSLKQRTKDKGLILLISCWEQLDRLIKPLPSSLLLPVKQSWPGHVTWVFPKSEQIPYCVSGSWDTIAIRMSAHPIAKALASKGPIISTSANIAGYEPARSLHDLERQFPQGIDFLVEGALGEASQPSQIVDVMTGKQLR